MNIMIQFLWTWILYKFRWIRWPLALAGGRQLVMAGKTSDAIQFKSKSSSSARRRVKCPTVIASAIHQMCDVFNLISLAPISAAPAPPAAKTDQDERSVISHLRRPGVRKTSGAARKSKYSIETSRGWGIRHWQSHRDTCYQEWFAQRLLVLFIREEHFGFMSLEILW